MRRASIARSSTRRSITIRCYVVTLFGTPAQLARIEEVVAPSLRVATHTGAPLVPQTSRLLQPDYTTAVARAFDSTVMIVAADVIDGRLKPRAGGSGVIVGADGSILTQLSHRARQDRPPARRVRDRALQLARSGAAAVVRRPAEPQQAAARFRFALLKCDMDSDGRAWNPATAGGDLADAAGSDRGRRPSGASGCGCSAIPTSAAAA